MRTEFIIETAEKNAIDTPCSIHECRQTNNNVFVFSRIGPSPLSVPPLDSSCIVRHTIQEDTTRRIEGGGGYRREGEGQRLMREKMKTLLLVC